MTNLNDREIEVCKELERYYLKVIGYLDEQIIHNSGLRAGHKLKREEYELKLIQLQILINCGEVGEMC